MLEIASRQAEAAGVSSRVKLVEADFSGAPLEGPYQFAFIVNEHLPASRIPGSTGASVRHWHAHLAPGGLLLIEVIHPDVNQLAGLDGRIELLKTWIDPARARRC